MCKTELRAEVDPDKVMPPPTAPGSGKVNDMTPWLVGGVTVSWFCGEDGGGVNRGGTTRLEDLCLLLLPPPDVAKGDRGGMEREGDRPGFPMMQLV